MLKKFVDRNAQFIPGAAVYLVTRNGEILENYTVVSVLGDLVSLDRSPIEGTEKQGFSIEGDLLRPNWCAGKRKLVAACRTHQRAEELAKEIRQEIELGKTRPPPKPCTG